VHYEAKPKAAYQSHIAVCDWHEAERVGMIEDVGLS